MAPKRSKQASIRVVIQRAGTSKGLVLQKGDLSARGSTRDRLLARLIGSPNVSRVDGLGGSRPITSKVAVLSAMEREDAGVDHTSAQVDIASAGVGSICLAAASGIPGSTACGTAERRRSSILSIGHPFGITPAVVEAEPIDESPYVAFQNFGFSRTAHRLMDGRAYHLRNLSDEAAEAQAQYASA